MQGRPLRFLAMVLAGWIGWRVFMLWPTTAFQMPVEAPGWHVAAAADPSSILPSPARAATLWDGSAPPPVQPRDTPGRMTSTLPSASHRDRDAFAMAGMVRFGSWFAPGDARIDGLTGGASAHRSAWLPAPARAPDRAWQASAWLVTRGGPATGIRQLGGSQAGLTLRRAFAPDWGGYGRATMPLTDIGPTPGAGAELALGIDWQLPGAPIRLIAEQRIALDGQRGGPAVGAVGGIAPDGGTDIDVEAFGQIGMVWRDRGEPYGDGFVRVSQRLGDVGAGRLDFGLGAWGAAQRDAHRVDIGPSIGARVPVGGKTLRASVDWRERITGDPRPGSGPALTLAADF